MARQIDSDPARLIQRARSGDPEALGDLLQLYRDYLLLVAESQLYRYRRQWLNASDAVQEALLKAQGSFLQFQGSSEGELVAWLRKILANSIVSLARQHFGLRRSDGRRERQLSELLDRSSDAMAAVFAAPGASPSSVAARREQAVLFAQAIQQLPGHYREVILLRHLQELPFAEIALRMGRTVDSVQKLWVRALDHLRRALQGSLGEK